MNVESFEECCMAEERKYWFPAKRYGWGWGPPTAWQGWVVLLVFFALVLGGAATILPREGAPAFLLYTLLLVVVLIGICWIKGERPRWRRGGDKGG
jgi:drug/metabolite transporter (DMT)-like permease